MQPIDSLLNFDSTNFISWSLQIELSSSCRQMVLAFFRLEIFLVSLTDKNDLLHMKICFIYENAMLNSSLKWYQNPRDAMKWTYSEHNRRTIHEWAMRSFYCVWIGHTQCVQCSVFRMFAWIHLILMRLLWISLCAGSTHRRAKYDRLAQYQPSIHIRNWILPHTIFLM